MAGYMCSVSTQNAGLRLSHRKQQTCSFVLCPCSVLCRDEAQKLWAERAALEGLGLKVVCVVHEWIDREVRCLR